MREILLVLAAADGRTVRSFSGWVAPHQPTRTGKTPALRFDTLVVRGDQLKKAGWFPRTEIYCTTDGESEPRSFLGA